MKKHTALILALIMLTLCLSACERELKVAWNRRIKELGLSYDPETHAYK